MRKKICLLLIFLLVFLGFNLEVRAEDTRYRCATKGTNIDYSLNYDIEDFQMVNGNLNISGWVVRHNCDNYGGTNLNVSFRFVSSDGRVVGVEPNGDILDDFKVNFTSRDLTYPYCYKDKDNACTGEYFNYNNVGFDISLPIEKYLSQLSNNEWSLMIHYKFYFHDSAGARQDVEGDENLAVYTTKVNSASFKNASFKLFGVGDKVDIIGNHVKYNDESTYYWKLAKGYVVSERIEGTPATYKLENAGGDGALNYGFENCGFDKATQSNLVEKKCIGPGTAEKTSISSIFVKASGAVKIKYVGSSDHICNVSTGTLNACTGGSIENNCSKMTVYDEERNISAVVSIKESSNIIPGEDADYIDNYNSYFGIDYSKYNIVKGKTFHYALTYTNTASWSIVEGNYGNLSQSEGDQAISAKMRNYYNEIGNNFVANVSVKSNDIEKFNTAGTWDCTGGRKDDFVDDDKTTTLICKYNLKYLYIDGNGDDTYYGDILKNSNGDELTLGRNFYIPLSYKKDKFTWEVSSSSSLNTVMVRTNKDVKTPNSSLLKIDIISSSSSDDNNQCSIKIVDSNDVPDGDDDNYSGGSSGDSSGDPGYNSNSEYVNDKLYVYRTVDVNNPFPDGYIPKNWNNTDFIKRLQSSYDNLQKPDYETVPMTAKIINNVRGIDTVYTSWEDTITSGSDNSGSNNFVGNATYFNTIYSGNHCKFGLYNSKCDGRVW